MESHSLLKPIRSGAVSIGSLFYEPFPHNVPFQGKITSFAEEKSRVVRTAAAIVQPGQTIAISRGTITMEVAPSLKVFSSISIITGTVNVAMELSNSKDIEVIVIDRILRGRWFVPIDLIANAATEMTFAGLMFIGADGIDAEYGTAAPIRQRPKYFTSLPVT